MADSSGQATVELIAALPALLLAALVALQLLAAGYALTLADGRPRPVRWRSPAAARQRRRPARRCPAGPRTRSASSVEGGRVTVRLRPPSPFGAVAERLAVTSARARGRRDELRARADAPTSLVTAVGGAEGARGAAAALACAGADVDRAALLVDLGGAPAAADPDRLGGGAGARGAPRGPPARPGSPRAARSAIWRRRQTTRASRVAAAAVTVARGALAVVLVPPELLAGGAEASGPRFDRSCCAPTSPPTGRCWRWSVRDLSSAGWPSGS